MCPFYALLSIYWFKCPFYFVLFIIIYFHDSLTFPPTPFSSFQMKPERFSGFLVRIYHPNPRVLNFIGEFKWSRRWTTGTHQASELLRSSGEYLFFFKHSTETMENKVPIVWPTSRWVYKKKRRYSFEWKEEETGSYWTELLPSALKTRTWYSLFFLS